MRWLSCHVPFRTGIKSLPASRAGRWSQGHQYPQGINGLALLVEQALGLNPFEPAIYVFSNRRRDRIKLLLWDRTGFWLMIKRLEADRFCWPKAASVVTLTVEQLHWLLAGIDLAAMQPHPVRIYTKTS